MSGKILADVTDIQERSRIPSIALTHPAHIREAAAMLFNRYHKEWGGGGRHATATEVRALAALLSLVRVTMTEVGLDGRLRYLEEVVGAESGEANGPAGSRRTAGALPPTSR